MATTQQITQYNYSVYWNDPYSAASFSFTVSGTSNFGDAEAFALLSGIKAAFPAALTANGNISKNDTTVVSYTTNTGSTPPSFQ